MCVKNVSTDVFDRNTTNDVSVKIAYYEMLVRTRDVTVITASKDVPVRNAYRGMSA
jgi:hypothetical protein